MTINSIDAAILDGIAGELGGTTRVVEEAEELWMVHGPLLLRVNSHCSFSLCDDKLIKNCEAAITISLANPNYLSVLQAAVKYCDQRLDSCSCSNAPYPSQWKRIVKRINAKA